MASDKRFIKSYSQGGAIHTGVQIWVDRQTGVNYLYVQSGYSGGLTPLLDQNGKPVVTSVPKNIDK